MALLSLSLPLACLHSDKEVCNLSLCLPFSRLSRSPTVFRRASLQSRPAHLPQHPCKAVIGASVTRLLPSQGESTRVKKSQNENRLHYSKGHALAYPQSVVGSAGNLAHVSSAFKTLSSHRST